MTVRQGSEHEEEEVYHDKIYIVTILPAFDEAHKEIVVWLIG